MSIVSQTIPKSRAIESKFFASGLGFELRKMILATINAFLAKLDCCAATEELDENAVEVARHVKDLHVNLLHLLGLDDNKLTFFHGGRCSQSLRKQRICQIDFS